MPTIDLPDWLARIALADVVSADLLVLVAGASNAAPPEDLDSFVAELVEQGILRPDGRDHAGTRWLINPELRMSMLEALSRMPGGVVQVRTDLIQYGMTSFPASLLGQFAIWAHQNADWATLAHLWLQTPPLSWVAAGPAAVAVFADLPAAARRSFPSLTLAAALTAGLDPSHAGTFSEQTEGKLRQDGRLLHAGWASLRGGESMLRAGSLWMVGQRSMPGATDPLGDSWKTHTELSDLIEAWTHAGHPPTSRAQTFFHTMSAQTALLRGDLHQARSECEQAMMLSQSRDISALTAAGLSALTLIISGNVHGYERAAVWYEANAPSCGPFAAIAEPYFRLAQALAAIRLLDREAATEHLRQASALEQGSEFWPFFAWVSSLHDLTWRNPDFGLSRLDAAENGNPFTAEHESLGEAMATRTRAELLCGAGQANQARALLKARGHSTLARYRLVSEARMHLCALNGSAAVRVADTGVHDPTLSLPDRAHLFAIKSAALLLDAADAELVRGALHAACTLSSECADVLPFVFLPAELRAGLLELHDHYGHTTPCLLDDPTIRARLGQVRDNFGSSARLVRLTPREEVLLPLLATPQTADEIAHRLQVSVNTVRKQVATLREKLAARDRASLIATAYSLGLLDGRDVDH